MATRTHRHVPKKKSFFSAENYSFVSLLLLSFLIILAAGGGSARPDVWSLLFVRPVAVIVLTALVLFAGPRETADNPMKVPLALLAALAAYMLLQLTPLPPGIWTALPGHERYLGADTIIGGAGWRPISLTPSLTWNSLLSLIVPAAVCVAFLKGADKFPQAITALWLAIGLLCLMLGLIQAISPDASPLYLYKITNRGLATGLFANRNHTALFLAAMVPVGLVWLEQRRVPGRRPTIVFQSIVAAAALLIAIGVLATGSRAGVILGCFAGVFSLAIHAACASPARRSAALKLALPAGATILAIAVLLIVSGRDNAVTRLLNVQAYSTDLRVVHAPLVQSIAHDFFPFGSGFGSFDLVFRGYEPDATLSPEYFNHAHNDLLELLMTGGLPAVCIAAALSVWWLSRTIAAWRARSTTSLAGAAIILLFAGASVADYPLRTPLAAALFVTACWWLGNVKTATYRSRSTKNDPFTHQPSTAIRAAKA